MVEDQASDEQQVPYAGAGYVPVDTAAVTTAPRSEIARWTWKSLVAHASLYLTGLGVWALETDLAYPVALWWLLALGIGLLAGLALLLAASTRKMAAGILRGTAIALVIELLVTAAVWGLWLAAHPGFELS